MVPSASDSHATEKFFLKYIIVPCIQDYLGVIYLRVTEVITACILIANINCNCYSKKKKVNDFIMNYVQLLIMLI